MDFTHTKREGEQVLVVSCDLDEAHVRRLQEHLELAVESSRGNVYVDMEGVNAICSEALRVMRQVADRVRGGELVLLHVKQEVMRVTLQKAGLRHEPALPKVEPELRVIVEDREFNARSGDAIGRAGTNAELSQFMRELSKRNSFYAEFSREHFRLTHADGQWRLRLLEKGARPRRPGEAPYPYYETWGLNTTWLDGREITPGHDYPLPGPKHRITVSQKVTVVLNLARQTPPRANEELARNAAG